MDIFEILKEAKNPSSKPQRIAIQEEDTPSDYTEDVEADDQETEETDDTSNDNQEEVENDSEETSDESIDDSEGDDTVTDYTEEADDQGDSDSDSSTYDEGNAEITNQSPEDRDDAQKNAILIKNCVALYYSIKSSVDKLNKVNNLSVMTNKINIQVKQNLSEIMEQLYDHITLKFSNNSYVKNLYIYNYFIEAYKINIEMLRKNEQFQ